MNNLIISLHTICAAAWRRRYVIVLPILIFPFIGLFIGIVAPKKYVTYTTILIQEPAMLNPLLKDLAVSIQLKKRIDALDALVHSRHVLSKVSKKLKLINPDMSTSQKEEVYKTLSERLKLKQLGNNMVELRYETTDPTNMAEILTKISHAFIEVLLAPQVSSINSSKNFLKQHLEKQHAQLLKAERKLAEFKTKYAGDLPSLHDSNVVRWRQLKEKLAEKETELAGAKAALKSQQHRLSQSNPVITKLEDEIVKANVKLISLRSRYSDKHSEIQATIRQIKRLRSERNKILKNSKVLNLQEMRKLWNHANSATIQPNQNIQPMLFSQLQQLHEADVKVQQLSREVRNIKLQVGSLEKKIKSHGKVEQQLNSLERNIKVKKEIYQRLLQRHEMTRVISELGRHRQPDNVKVIDLPVQPTKPTNFPLALYIIAGLFGGATLGMGISIILEMADTSVRRKDYLEDSIGISVITRIPNIKARHQNNDNSSDYSAS